MAQTIGLRPRRSAIVSVHARTDGNPFFVAELARLLHSEGLLHDVSGAVPDRHGDHPVPRGVEVELGHHWALSGSTCSGRVAEHARGSSRLLPWRPRR